MSQGKQLRSSFCVGEVGVLVRGAFEAQGVGVAGGALRDGCGLQVLLGVMRGVGGVAGYGAGVVECVSVVQYGALVVGWLAGLVVPFECRCCCWDGRV